MKTSCFLLAQMKRTDQRECKINYTAPVDKNLPRCLINMSIRRRCVRSLPPRRLSVMIGVRLLLIHGRKLCHSAKQADNKSFSSESCIQKISLPLFWKIIDTGGKKINDETTLTALIFFTFADRPCVQPVSSIDSNCICSRLKCLRACRFSARRDKMAHGAVMSGKQLEMFPPPEVEDLMERSNCLYKSGRRLMIITTCRVRLWVSRVQDLQRVAMTTAHYL